MSRLSGGGDLLVADVPGVQSVGCLPVVLLLLFIQGVVLASNIVMKYFGGREIGHCFEAP